MQTSTQTSRDESSSDIHRIGVLGAGQMGAAAAVMFRRAGFQVKLWGRNEERLSTCNPTLNAVDDFLNLHFGKPATTTGTLELESSLSNLDSFSDAVLECVAEDMAQKVQLLSELASCREREVLVMSCTSALSITEMARGSGLVKNLVGAHFWNPPHLIPVVEVVAGSETPPHQVHRAQSLLKQLGKIPVNCADVPGFIGNRLMHAMWREALALVQAGICSVEDVDRVVKWTFALRLPAIGPMENMDIVGLSLVESVQRYLLPDLATNALPSTELTSRLSRDETGMRAGRGFYDWSTRNAASTIALRDEQIVHQLLFLEQHGAFDELDKT